MSYQLPQDPELAPKKTGTKSFFTKPAVLASIVMATIMIVGVWFFISFINAASNPTEENSINYYGVAEVLDVRATTKKCYVEVRREDGRETRQSMARAECGKFHKGDFIVLENGQFVGHSPIPAMPSMPSK